MYIVEELQVEGLFVGIDLMLSGGNLHAPQDSHESKDQSPFSNITSIIFWWNLFIRILWVFQWNPYLKTDGTSNPILFYAKDLSKIIGSDVRQALVDDEKADNIRIIIFIKIVII